MTDDLAGSEFVHPADPPAAPTPAHAGGGGADRGRGHERAGAPAPEREEELTAERLAQLELEIEEANEALLAAGSPVRLALLAEDGTYDVAVTVPDASGTPSYCVARRLRAAEFGDWARRLIELEGLVVDRAG